MNILAISSQLPMPDRASGDLRFFSILKILAKDNDITIAIYASDYQREQLGIETYKEYKNQLEKLSINISTKCIDTIKNKNFDIVWFEFYFATKGLIDLVRFHQPNAYVIVDSVDVHFNRLEAKARLTHLKSDFETAAAVKKEELQAYRDADIVVTVTENEKNLLYSACPDTEIAIIPNIYNIPEFTIKSPSKNVNLIFVGGFNHKPNIDAVYFFCTEVMPLLRSKFSNIHLNIVGSSPTQEVLKLSANDIAITGYVPSVEPYYKEADIVIAPLRYGGGMKGKVGEAFSFSTPVVTTDFGAEGFGITPDEHFLLANTPDEFVNAILKLSNDKYFYQLIAKNGWQFIKEHYSEKAADIIINNIFDNLNTTNKKKFKFIKWLNLSFNQFLNRNILWRFTNHNVS